MAKAKRKNIKTHPDTPDPDAGGFVNPERTDLNGRSDEAPVTIDLNANSEVALDADGEGDGDGDAAASRVERTDPPAAAVRGSRRQADGADADAREGTYVSKVQKRIARERNIANRERTLREQTQRALDAERGARQAQDERIARLERAQNDVANNTDVKGLEAKIKDITTKLGAAKEAGETALELQLTIELGEAQGDLKVLKYDLKKRGEAATVADTQRRAQEAANSNAANEVDSPITPDEQAAADEWIRANRHWYRRPSYAAVQKDAVAIDAEIIGDIKAGDLDMDLYSDEHFQELAKRLKEAHPDLPVVDTEGNDYEFSDEEDDMDQRDDSRGRDRDRRDGGRQNNRRGEPLRNGNGTRAPQGGIGQGGRRQLTDVQLAKQGKVNLNQADFNQMRTFGMDPNNADHKKAFAKERMRTIVTEDSRGTR